MIDRKGIKKILDYDREHVWHPYTSMTNPLKVYPVESADKVRIKLLDGTELIDGMSSWWAAIHGYNHPVLNKAVKSQLKKMSHVMFGGLTHEPAVGLSEKLIQITPEPLTRIFFADSGSVAVEVAMKMAFQYWHARGKPDKNRLITVKSGYHGDTFFAMSVCDPVTGMHGMFNNVFPEHFFAKAPLCGFHDRFQESDIHSIRSVIEKNHEKSAAVILEPIVQGAGGMRFYSPQFLNRLRRICNKYNLLLIFDEIATGFGRTGKLFASGHTDIAPDIMCVGKALTGGYMTLAATLTTRDIARTISQGISGVFMHGPTFMGNPLACSTALASINLLLSYDWNKKIKTIEKGLGQGLAPCRDSKHVKDVRVLGAIGVVEMEEPVDVGKIQEKFIKKGIWIRPFGNLVYTMPPYIINEKDLKTLTRAIKETIYETGK
ncbi:MAG: adenosylmethionine--8-amino-7-oxononanoate transaminase [Deltaproteobacteria bacterium]|nr:adenosylmethionine--8-amino-7-oxononanoate transaminase [Deltaproteobacteria bacterium]